MPETFQVVKAKNAGEKDNPHGGKLVKWYLTLRNQQGGEFEDVYCQKKPGNDLVEGSDVYGRLESGEYGWRLFPEQQQNGAQGGSQTLSKDDYWRRKDERDVESQARMGRAHAQEMGIRWAYISDAEGDTTNLENLLPLIDWFHQDVQRFPLESSAEEQRPEANPAVQRQSEAGIEPAAEASPAQKRKLTEMFNKAGLAREAQKAIVLWRCKSEKATKQGASQLITDLVDGATAEALLAEVWDGKRAGDPIGARAAALIPVDVPGDTEGLPPADDIPSENGDDVPF